MIGRMRRGVLAQARTSRHTPIHNYFPVVFDFTLMDGVEPMNSLASRVTIPVEYYRVTTHKYTFKDPTVRKWVEKELEGRVLNLFAGETELRHDRTVVTNDIEPKRPVDHSFNALNEGAIHEHLGEEQQFDTVVFDPPFSVYKSNQKYSGNWTGEDAMLKDQLAELLKAGGKVIHFGYTTSGMGKSRGFKKKKAVIWNHPGRQKDTLSVVDVKQNTSLSTFE